MIAGFCSCVLKVSILLSWCVVLLLSILLYVSGVGLVALPDSK